MKATLVIVGMLVVTAPIGCFFDLANDCNFNMTLACFYENAGGGGTGGSGGSSPECVPSETNPEIEDVCGVFVSAAGSDANGDGTKEKPYRTLGKGVMEGGAVYACADEATPFDERVEPLGEVTIYGGLDCANGWLYDAAKKSGWTAPADTVPLVVGGEAKVTVVDFAIVARDAEKAGGSSLGVLAFGEAAEVVLERCDVSAGDGAVGVTPEKPAGSGPPGANGQDGADGCVDVDGKPGGNGGQTMCDGTSTNGGLGGTGTSTSDGGPGVDGDPVGDAGKGGKEQDAGSCGNGENGADGTPGTPGDGGTGVGMLTESGYVGVWGGDGKSQGGAGQGGGGGGGGKVCATMGFAGPGGGGGGSGGCGGGPGKGGGAGGSSIGIASVGAKLMLSQVTVSAKKGGAGGTGGDGQNGGLGGTSGKAGSNNGDAQASACDGGKGGKGGDGGGGGGGQGGHSVGIAFTGKAPSLTAGVTITPGGAGPGGFGGNMSMENAAKGGLGRICKTLSFDDGACTP